ncbi:MAG: cobalamin-dependent protein [Anaerolineales bacterium]|jgi:methanogenic corrinoid protein MtbC1
MVDNDLRTKLINSISNLQEETALAFVQERITRGDDPIAIIDDCSRGMQLVGERYEAGEYFLAGLIMAGEIFSQVMEWLQPIVVKQVTGKSTGRILVGTVQGDIHDLGKNILTMLLSCHSFAVHDLGVDVSPNIFREQASEFKPHIVGLSGLLTSSYDSMRETIAQIRDGGYRGPIIIGGGQITEEVSQYVKADSWATDAISGVELCRRLIGGQPTAS